mmetsp:Transcript_120923/g.349384  ORF Transcript_120923/g.349384 Transcript_120923/m.349384 type:complete len:262 (-) Transcript_120923:165-950(-)
MGLRVGPWILLARPVECHGLCRRCFWHHRVDPVYRELQPQLLEALSGAEALALIERVPRDEAHRGHHDERHSKVGERVDHGLVHLHGVCDHRHHVAARCFLPEVPGDREPRVLLGLRARRMLAVEFHQLGLRWPPLRGPLHVRAGRILPRPPRGSRGGVETDLRQHLASSRPRRALVRGQRAGEVHHGRGRRHRRPLGGLCPLRPPCRRLPFGVSVYDDGGLDRHHVLRRRRLHDLGSPAVLYRAHHFRLLLSAECCPRGR